MKFIQTIILFSFLFNSFCQNPSSGVVAISIEQDDDFSGFNLMKAKNERLFVLGENWHNIRYVPQATLKLLQYLHKVGNVRILAIEHGKSVAYMVNEYLESGSSIMLEHITRNTMFWGKEHRDFFEQLRNFNLSLPKKKRIKVQSIDIEYKQESAIFMINQFIDHKQIPASLIPTVGEFKRIYEETKEHRESFDGLAIMFYYDREFTQQLVIKTINDLEDESQKYIDFFGEDFTRFATMILEMDDGLTFDYTNPNQHYRFRDRLIYKNFIELANENPNAGILCPIGMKHMMNHSSLSDLNSRSSSPFFGQVTYIRIAALHKNSIGAGDLKKINFNFPDQLKVNHATLIYHDPNNPLLRTNKDLDYTIFLNDSESITPFENVLTEGY